MKYLALAALVASVLLLPTGTSASTESCSPKAGKPQTGIQAGWAHFNAQTFNCGSVGFPMDCYQWTAKMIDAQNGVVLWQYSGGSCGDIIALNNPRVYCLRHDGTARTVRDTLYINVNGQGKFSQSDTNTCVRIGGTVAEEGP